MQRNILCGIFIVVSIALLAPASFVTGKEADKCAKDGVLVKNLTMLDLWYKKNNGDCTIWRHNHVFFIKSEDTIEIFSDLTCSSLYCGNNPGYKDYRSIDANKDCKVRMLPDCKLSDI